MKRLVAYVAPLLLLGCSTFNSTMDAADDAKREVGKGLVRASSTTLDSSVWYVFVGARQGAVDAYFGRDAALSELYRSMKERLMELDKSLFIAKPMGVGQ